MKEYTIEDIKMFSEIIPKYHQFGDKTKVLLDTISRYFFRDQFFNIYLKESILLTENEIFYFWREKKFFQVYQVLPLLYECIDVHTGEMRIFHTSIFFKQMKRTFIADYRFCIKCNCFHEIKEFHKQSCLCKKYIKKDIELTNWIYDNIDYPYQTGYLLKKES
jgi:hypothetical protein